MTAVLADGGMVPVDPTNIRPLAMLAVAEELVKAADWPYRALTVTMASHYGPGSFTFFGANHPDAITAVHERRVDISVLNLSTILTMAQRGRGPFPGRWTWR